MLYIINQYLSDKFQKPPTQIIHLLQNHLLETIVFFLFIYVNYLRSDISNKHNYNEKM